MTKQFLIEKYSNMNDSKVNWLYGFENEVDKINLSYMYERSIKILEKEYQKRANYGAVACTITSMCYHLYNKHRFVFNIKKIISTMFKNDLEDKHTEQEFENYMQTIEKALEKDKFSEEIIKNLR